MVKHPQHYAMFGLGKTGQATARALAKAGHDVVAWDDGQASREAFAAAVPNVTLVAVEDWTWKRLDALVLSPGVPLHFPQPHRSAAFARANGVRITSDIELFCDAHASSRVIGITGTNGKSTTTTLIGHIFAAAQKPCAVGGNLGTPVMDLPALHADGSYIFELSSYQLDLCDHTRVHTAVLLNFSPDHLDRHGSMAGYIAAKKRIFAHQQSGDTAIIGMDDADACAVYDDMRARAGIRTLAISGCKPCAGGVYVQEGMLIDDTGDAPIRFDLRAIKALQGEHNWQNAAAAYAACVIHSIAPQEIYAAMQSFAGLDHRMQWLGEISGVQFVNDSKATNADAAEKALKTYDHIFWIAGGVAKEGGITSLTPYFSKIAHAYVIGEAAPDMAAVLAQKQVTYTCSQTLDHAMTAAFHDAKQSKLPGACVLLSPACASFDQYPNFEARGAHFMRLFAALKEGSHVHAG